MKRIVYAAMCAVALSTAAYFWYISYSSEPSQDSRWSTASLADATSLRVQGRHGDVVLTRESGAWEARLVDESQDVVPVRADFAKVEGYVERIGQIQPLRAFSPGEFGGKGQYGLDAPDVTMTADVKGAAASVVFKFTSDGAGTVYGWTSERDTLVYEFGDALLEAIDVPASHFFDTRVFSLDEEAVVKVQLMQPFGSSWLVERGEDGFAFALPGYLKDKPASDSALKLYIHMLGLLKANSLALESAEIDGSMPALTIAVWQADDKEPQRLDVFARADGQGGFLGRSSWLTAPFAIDAASVNQMVKSAFDIQGRTVVQLDTGAVTRLFVRSGEREYLAARSEDGWRLADDDAPVQGVDMALWRLTELQFEALPLNNLPESAVALMQCILYGEGRTPLKELAFYADPALPQGQCWMKNGGGMYYPVSSRLLKDLQGLFPAN